jgi:hypothetical protein
MPVISTMWLASQRRHTQFKRVIGPLTVIDRSRRCVRVILVDPGAEAGRAELRGIAQLINLVLTIQ